MTQAEQPLAGRVLMVTGASRGLGADIAVCFARAGADVVLAARDAGGLAEQAAAVRSHGRRALPVVTDVRSEASIRQMVTRAEQEFGHVDILVNNAGIGFPGPIHQLTAEQWDEIFAVNLRGAFLCTRHVLPDMLARRSGHIVNIASVDGKRGIPNWAAYSASKFGMLGFGEALAREVRPHGIRVTNLSPGIVDTYFGSGQKEPDRAEHLQGTDVAELALVAVTLPPRAAALDLVLWSMQQNF